MRILGVEPFTRLPGHHQWFATRTCQALAARGHEVKLLTHGGLLSASDERLTFPVLDAAARRTRAVEDGRRSVAVLDLSNARLRRMRVGLRTFRAAYALLRQEPYDVVHYFDAHPLDLLLSFYGHLGRRLKGRPVLIANCHFIRPSPVKGDAWEAAKDWLHRQVLLTLMQRHLDALVVLDPSLKSALLEWVKLPPEEANRILLLPLPMNTVELRSDRTEARRELNLRMDETVLLCLGTLRRDKRIDLALQAFNGIPCSRLVIAGPRCDLDAADIKRMILEYADPDRVTVEVAVLSEARMRAYLHAADVVLLPYSPGFKGQSGILTWACAAGRPVIASDVGVLGQTVREAGVGFTIEAGNVQSLRNAILEFLTLTPDTRAIIGQRCRDLARRFSWDVVCAELENCYRALVNPKS